MPAPKQTRRLTAFIASLAVLIATPPIVVATDAFGDVADTNVHHGDITWLRDADVTRGCNPPANDEYCPGDPVLRQQMASFLRRLAENQVVDAGLLGGEGPDAYKTVVSYFECGFESPSSTTCATSEITPGEASLVGELSLEVPAAGVTELTASIGAGTLGSTQFLVWLTTEASCADAPDAIIGQSLGGQTAATSREGSLETVPVSAVDIVETGRHTYKLCAYQAGILDSQAIFTASLYGRWTEAPATIVTSSGGTVTDHGQSAIGG